MRTSLSIRTLMRTPLKTLLMFLLLTATSYMLFFSVVEYSVTAREFERTAGFYKGVGAAEAASPTISAPSMQCSYGIIPAPGTDVYLYADARTSGMFSGENTDRYNYKEISRADISALENLPHIERAGIRYMTAGVSSDMNRLSDRTDYYDYSARFILEATFSSAYDEPLYTKDPVWVSIDLAGSHKEDGLWLNILEFTDIKLLAGSPDWFKAGLANPTEKIQLTAYELPQDAPDGSSWAIDFNTSTRYFSVFHYGQSYNNELYSRDFIESFVPGERYIIIGRIEPMADYRDTMYPRGCQVLTDSSTTGWWPQVCSLKGMPENYIELPEFAPLRNMIEITNTDLRTFDVVYTDSMQDIIRFTEGKMLLADGRLLTLEDTEAKSNVCVMHSRLMSRNGLSVGDTITLRLGDKLFEQNAAIGAIASVRERYADSFTDDIEFKIVGAYLDIDSRAQQAANPHWNYNDNTIFIPLTFLPVEVPDDHTVKPGEFSFIVNAKDISAFLEESRQVIENELGLKLFFSDGGWPAIERQINRADVLSVVRLILLAMTFLIAIGLTVYVFVIRKRKDYAVMRALGTIRTVSNRSLYIPLGVVAILGIAAGSILAYKLAGKTINDALTSYTELGLDTDTAIPVMAVAVSVICEIAVLTLITVFGLYRVGRKPPLELLQDSRKA